MGKINRNFGFIIAANSVLLGLGLFGWITPAMSALLHNLTTIGASTYSLLPILNKTAEKNERNESA